MNATPAECGAKRWGHSTRLERFNALVMRGPADHCWPWVGSRSNKGYGRVTGWRIGRRLETASVVAWAVANGRWPSPGEVVRHSCDNPPCCNPAHLLIGSHADNMRDARERRRHPVWAAADDRARSIAEEIERLTPHRAQILDALTRHPQPSSAEIGRAIGVREITVRHALTRLAELGLIQKCEWRVVDSIPERVERPLLPLQIQHEAAPPVSPRNGELLGRPITKRQADMLAFIDGFVRNHGFPPSVREIGDALGIASTNGVADHLWALERRDLIQRSGARARSIVITARGRHALDSRKNHMTATATSSDVEVSR